jgi:hypothetical protein
MMSEPVVIAGVVAIALVVACALGLALGLPLLPASSAGVAAQPARSAMVTPSALAAAHTPRRAGPRHVPISSLLVVAVTAANV